MTDDTSPDAGTNDAELCLPLDVVCAIVRLARAVQDKTATSAPEDLADTDDPAAEILEDRDLDASEAELRHLVDDLDEEAQADLVALMWLGRDDVLTWQDLRTLAAQEHNAFTSDYLLATPLLADHLVAGLDRLDRRCPPESW